jgi:hypothetical protein
VIPGDPRAIELLGCQDLEADEESEAENIPADDEEEEEEDASAEELAATYLISEMGGTLASSDRLRRLEDNDWVVTSVLRAGCFADQRDLLTDQEALELACGEAGGSQISFTGRARTNHLASWSRFRKGIAAVLFGNPAWRNVVDLWLDEISSRDTWEVRAHIYNPCDLLAPWVWSDVNDDPERLTPQLIIAAKSTEDPDDTVMVQGFISWNGKRRSAAREFKSVFETDFMYWLARSMGVLWQEDLRLMERLGLSYSLAEFVPGDEEPARLLEVDDAWLRRRPGSAPDWWPDLLPFQEFLDSSGSSLESIGARLRSRRTKPDWPDPGWLIQVIWSPIFDFVL